MFRLSLKLPSCIIKKAVLNVERRYVVRLYQTSSTCRKQKQIEGDKKECPHEGSGRAFYYTLGAVVIGTGAIVAYAKYDDDFRAWLRENVPGSDGFISFITAEETSQVDYVVRWFMDLQSGMLTEVWNLISGGKSGTGVGTSALPPCDEKQEPYKPPKAAYEPIIDMEPSVKDKYNEKRVIEVVEEGDQLITADPDTVRKIDKMEEDLKPANLVQLESAIGCAAGKAVQYYTDAVCALRDHAEDIYQLVEVSVENADPTIWRQIKKKGEERDRLVKEAEKAANEALSKIKELQERLNDPRLPGSEELKKTALRNVKRVTEAVDDAKKTYAEERAKASVTDKYWTKVQDARRHFSEELEILLPNVKLSDKEIKLAEGELDLFILYAFQNILFFQKELTKIDTLGNLRLQQALDQSKLGDPQAIDTAIEQELDKERRKIGVEFQKRMLTIKSDCERNMRLALKRQAEAHNDHLMEALEMKEKELHKLMQRQLDEKMMEEKLRFKEEVATMIARLKGIDDLMKCRAAGEKRARAAQFLWSACQSLESAIRGPYACAVPTADVIRPLENEISAVVKAAASNDELVDVVVSSIPLEARIRGVFPEAALRERFLTVERVAKRVALLPDGGASLPIMFLSYLQSFFIISPANPIPPYELANEPVEVGKFNTYEILQRARYWVDRGDFAQALRYMNLLDGAPHCVARDWINETRIFLETQQAAITLMAHAAAAGLSWSSS